MSKRDSRHYLGAPTVMKIRGEETDSNVLDYIVDNPDCTIKEISKSLDMTRGRADGSVTRLKEAGLINIQYFRRNNILIKKVVPITEIKKPFDEVTFPLSLLDVPLWEDKAYACALSRSSIRISPKITDEWRQECAFFSEIHFEKKEDLFTFKFNDEFISFYELPNSELGVSGYEDEILVTVDSTVIPVDAPYDYLIYSDPKVIVGRVVDFVIFSDRDDDPEPAQGMYATSAELIKKEVLMTTAQMMEG